MNGSSNVSRLPQPYSASGAIYVTDASTASERKSAQFCMAACAISVTGLPLWYAGTAISVSPLSVTPTTV